MADPKMNTQTGSVVIYRDGKRWRWKARDRNKRVFLVCLKSYATVKGVLDNLYDIIGAHIQDEDYEYELSNLGKKKVFYIVDGMVKK